MAEHMYDFVKQRQSAMIQTANFIVVSVEEKHYQ